MELIEPYIIDANIFMEASRRYYAFDIAKPFWEGLIKYAIEGKIFSIDKVYDEIMEGNDFLKEWADKDFKEFFHKSETAPVTSHYKDLVLWAESEPVTTYSEPAKKRFMERTNADPWVIAYAKMHKCTVVTSETMNYGKTTTIPIPNVCTEFNVPHCNTFDLLRKLKFSF